MQPPEKISPIVDVDSQGFRHESTDFGGYAGPQFENMPGSFSSSVQQVLALVRQNRWKSSFRVGELSPGEIPERWKEWGDKINIFLFDQDILRASFHKTPEGKTFAVHYNFDGSVDDKHTRQEAVASLLGLDDTNRVTQQINPA